MSCNSVDFICETKYLWQQLPRDLGVDNQRAQWLGLRRCTKPSDIGRFNVRMGIFFETWLIAFITFRKTKRVNVCRFVISKSSLGEMRQFTGSHDQRLSTLMGFFTCIVLSSFRQFFQFNLSYSYTMSCCFSRFIAREKQKTRRLEMGEGKDA